VAERDKHVVVAAHGHCFDGLVSAALFTHLRKTTAQRPLRFSYRSCGYGPNMQSVPERWLRGDENAIVDFRYTPSPKLTWYFDHHVTAFASDEQQRDALAKSERYFYDPGYGSCTKLIADIGAARYGVRFDRYEELIRWADRIDSASFESAEAAADRAEPVMQLAAVVEQLGDGDLLSRLAPRLLVEPLGDVARSDDIQELYAPIGAAQDLTWERIARGLERRGDVAYVDLHEAPLEASGKFVSYAVCPDALYSVSLVRMKQHYKVSVGYNPWSGRERRHDIAALCRRYGGGGHPVVGAVSVALDRLDEARRIALALVEELNR
jgi:hypothetical protein